jgi:hypothetical protein
MQKNLQRNAVSDFQEGLVLVRSLSGTNTNDNSTARAVTLDPGQLETTAFLANWEPDTNDSLQAGSFPTNGARTVKLRVFSTSNTATVQIQLKEFPHNGPRNRAQAAAGDLKTQGKGTLVADLTFTTGGSSTANTNPVTGAVVAATTFFETSTFSTTFSQASRINEYPSGSTTNEKFITIDVLGAKYLYPQILASTNLTSGIILIGMQRVD